MTLSVKVQHFLDKICRGQYSTAVLEVMLKKKQPQLEEEHNAGSRMPAGPEERHSSPQQTLVIGPTHSNYQHNTSPNTQNQLDLPSITPGITPDITARPIAHRNENQRYQAQLGTPRPEEVVTFVHRDREHRKAAVILSSRFVELLNLVLSGQRQIDNLKHQLKTATKRGKTEYARLLELDAIAPQTREEGAEWRLLKVQLQHRRTEIESLTEQLAEKQPHLDQLRNQVDNTFRDVLEEGGLLDVSTIRDASLDSNSIEPVAGPQTLSETHRDFARDNLNYAGQRLVEAHRRYDNQKETFRAQLKDYGEAVAQGQTRMTQSDFDRTQVKQARDTTGELLDAEEALDDAYQQAGVFGLIVYNEDRTSGFGDYPDGGYSDSVENEMIGSVDRKWILAWSVAVSGGEGDMVGGEVDEWESESVRMCESARTLANGKDKDKIDRWQLVCEGLRGQ